MEDQPATREDIDRALIRLRSRMPEVRKQAAKQLVAIGAPALALKDYKQPVRRAAAEALKPLLPQLKPGDRQHFTSEEMEALLQALGGKDIELTLAILKALEQIGDEKAIPSQKRQQSLPCCDRENAHLLPIVFELGRVSYLNALR